MWLFENPKNYPEMRKKIALSFFFILLFILFALSQLSDEFALFMSKISFGIEPKINDINISISYLYISCSLSIFEYAFKLHDKISDILNIRFNFDKNIIIKKSLEICEIQYIPSCVNRDNRNEIMRKVFYKYAGYGKPYIDVHLIYMALDAWSWFWILLETTLAIIILGVILLFIKFSWFNLLILFFILSFLILLLRAIMCSCIKYALLEVSSILDDHRRKKEVAEYLIKICNQE